MFMRRAARDNAVMGFRILAQRQWIATAVSPDSRPICTFCSAYDFHTVRIGHDPPFEDWYCRRHIKDGEGSRMCTMFSREPEADDE